MPLGIVHSKTSKKLWGHYYSNIHTWMDEPHKTILKWNHRFIKHCWITTPIIALFKFKKLRAPLVVLQHLYQDYEKSVLYMIIGFFVFYFLGYLKEYTYFFLFLIFLDTILKTIFDILHSLKLIPYRKDLEETSPFKKQMN